MKSKEDYVRESVRKAASDLKIALRESKAPDPASDAVCFHFQQAVEKMLKAWLAWKEEPPTRTHNIEVLLAACEKIDPSFQSQRGAEALTPYAVELRYPDEAYFPSPQEMREAADLALAATRFVCGRFGSDGQVFEDLERLLS